jgi:hypothetical protein
VPGIHALLAKQTKDVDGRDKPGHDEMGVRNWPIAFHHRLNPCLPHAPNYSAIRAG